MTSPAEEVLLAFALTLFAGFTTAIGSAIAFFARRTDYRFLGVAMGFSAGVVIYVSFVEILPKADAAITKGYGSQNGRMDHACIGLRWHRIHRCDRCADSEGGQSSRAATAG
jgi:hypothetical protein